MCSKQVHGGDQSPLPQSFIVFVFGRPWTFKFCNFARLSAPRTREGGEGEKREKEETQKRKRRCSHLRRKRPRTHQEKKRRVPSYDRSIQGHPGKKERGGKKEKQKEREREGGREREREEKKKKKEEVRRERGQVFPATKQGSRDTLQGEGCT